MSPDSLAVRLRQARGAMSLARAAERTGMSENRIRLYEEGRRQPYRKTLRRLAEVYGVPVRTFMEADDAPGSAGESPNGDSADRASARLRRRRRRPAAANDGGAPTSVAVPVEVEPGETVTVSIELEIRAKGGADAVAAQAGDAAGAAAAASSRPEREAPDDDGAADADIDGVRRAYREFRRERT